MSDQTTAWLRSGEYLPPFMRDFHDQKDLFKALQEVVERRNARDGRGSYTADLTWIAAHVYTVDVFLWLMAKHGYTLQKSRKPVPFDDLDAWLTTAKERERELSAGALRSAFAAARERSEHLSDEPEPPTTREGDG